MSADWSPEKIAQLEALWRNNTPASQIAVLLANGATRLAVIGKLTRMGLTDKARAEPTGKAEIAPPVTTAPETPRIARESDAEDVERAMAFFYPATDEQPGADEAGASVTLMRRKENQCRRPVGRNADDLTLFCGAPRDGKSPYCFGCRARMYEPRAARKDHSYQIPEAGKVAASPMPRRMVG